MTTTLVPPVASGPVGSGSQPPLTTATWSRRGFLGAMSSLSVAAVAGCSMPDNLGEDMGAGNNGGGGLGLGGRRGSGGSDPQYQPLEPYELQAECELTQDFFSVVNQPIDAAKDTVVAYSRADGDVEAIVLQGGVIYQYYRDPSAPGGWAAHIVSDPQTPDATAVVAGMSSVDPQRTQGAGRWLKVFWTRKPAGSSQQNPTLYIATERTPPTANSAPGFDVSQVGWGAAATGLQVAANADDSLLVAAMQPSTVSKGKTNSDARLWFWTDGRSADHDTGQGMPASGGYLTGFQYTKPDDGSLANAGLAKVPWAAVVARPYQGIKGQFGVDTPTLMLYLPAGSYDPNNRYAPVVQIWAWTVRSGLNQKVSKVYPWNQTIDHPDDIPIADGFVYAASVEYVSTLGGTNTPSMLVQTVSIENEGTPKGDMILRLWIGSHDTHATTQPNVYDWTWTELGDGVPSQGDWLRAFSPGLRPLDPTESTDPGHPVPKSFLDVFVVVHGALTVFRQAPTGSAHLDYSRPVYTPAIPLETEVQAMAGQAAQSSGDELLFVDAEGHLRTLTRNSPTSPWSDATVQLPATQAQALDCYRVHLSITDDRGFPISGAALSLSASSAATMLVDQTDGTSTSIQVDQASSTPLTTGPNGHAALALVAQGVSAPTLTVSGPGGSTLTVYPSAALNTYFQGGSQLNYLDPIDQAGTLANAQTEANKPVFPGAKDQSAANDALATMAKAADQATAKGLTSARRSATLARRDGTVPRSRQHDKAALQGIVKDIDNWTHDALHAIKKGAAKVKKISYDAGSGVFTIIGDFEGWADQAISFVVKGFEDAAHVIHAVFNKLEAAIEDAIHWLKAEVIGTLVDSFKLAAQYEKWIIGDPGGQVGLLPYLQTQIANGEGYFDNWLDSTEDRIKHDFDAWLNAADRTSSMHSMASTAALPTLGGSRRARAASGDEEYPGKHHGAWLFNFSRWKVTFGDGINTNAIKWSLVDDLAKAIAKAMEVAAADLLKSVHGFAEFWMNAIKHPHDIFGLLEWDLLNAVEKIIEFAFYLVREIADVFFAAAGSVLGAFEAILFGTQLVPVPGLAKLLELVGIPDVTLGRFLLAILAFPAVVTHKIKHHGDGYPFQTTQLSGHRKGATNAIEEDILGGSAGISFLWAVVDAESSLYIVTKEEAPRFIAILDILIPIILTVLDTPNTEGKKPFTPPPWHADTCFGYLAWALGLGDAILAAIELKAEHQLKDDKAALAELTDNLLVAEMSLGNWLLIFSCLQAHADHDDGFEYADAVFDSLPLMAALLLRDEILVDTALVSAGIDAAITAGSGLVSAVLYAREAADS